VTSEQKDASILRQIRERKELQERILAIRGDLHLIGSILESLGQSLQSVGSDRVLSTEEIAVLDSARVQSLLADFKRASSRFVPLNEDLTKNGF